MTLPPKTWPRAWCPRQTPSTGTPRSAKLRMACIENPASFGVHARRADVDTGVEVARVGEVPDGAAIRAAAIRLELVDDLHRTDLRSARERACGKRRSQRLHRADVGAQRSRHLRDDVHDVRVAL